VSTDIYRVSAVRPDVTLPAILSKLMAAGLPLPEAIRSVTERPARVLGLEGRLGTLGEGAEADVAVFRLAAGERVFRGIPEAVLEAEGRDRRAEEELVGRHWLEPVHFMVGGRLMGKTVAPALDEVGAR
jgi:predicted amidohydrolase